MLDATAHHVPNSPETAPFPQRNDAPCYSIPRWACVYTHPQAERWADKQLRHRGYVTYLPIVTVTRRDPVVRSRRHDVDVPAFSRYLFIQFDGSRESWSPIREAPGVRDLVRCGPEIRYTDSRAVEALRAALAAKPLPNHSWTVGAACSLNGGAFYGMPAVITAIHGDTATIGLMMLGHLRQISVPIDSLMARDEQGQQTADIY